MSDQSITNLKDIFESHSDTDVNISIFGSTNIQHHQKLMSKKAFVEIVTKLIKADSRGNAHKNLKALYKSLEIS